MDIPAEYQEIWKLAEAMGLGLDVPVKFHPSDGYQDPYISLNDSVFIDRSDVNVLPQPPGTLGMIRREMGFRVYTINHIPQTQWEPPDQEEVNRGGDVSPWQAVQRAFVVYFTDRVDASLQHESEKAMEAEISKAEEQAEELERSHLAAEQWFDPYGEW